MVRGQFANKFNGSPIWGGRGDGIFSFEVMDSAPLPHSGLL